MAEVRFQVLDVGQGSGNFVEIYTDDKDVVLGGTILIDLGTERDPGDLAQTATIEYVRERLASMTTPTINLLVLTHSDTDHINLIADLLGKFTPQGQPPTPTKPNLLIETAWYAGEFDKFVKHSKANVITLINSYMATGTAAAQYSTGFSSFKTDPPPCYSKFDVKVYTLIAQVVNEKSKASKETPHWINTRSAVLLVSYKDKIQWVVTGDATGNTLYQLNQILGQMQTDGRLATYMGNVFMLTAPHHGSYATTFDIKGVRKKVLLPRDNTVNFANYVKAKCLSASAERVDNFKHPHWDVLSALSGPVGKDKYFDPAYPIDQYGEHAVTVFIPPKTFAFCPWPATGNFYSFNTTSNIFTNLYCVTTTYYNVTIPPAPNAFYNPTAISAPPYDTIALGASWQFRDNGTGYGFVSKRDNRRIAGPLAQHPSIRAAAAAQARFIQPMAETARGSAPIDRAPPPDAAPSRLARLRVLA